MSGIIGNCSAVCEKNSDCPGEATCTGDFCQKPLVCTGGGGGGSGGAIYIQAKKVIAPASVGASLLVPGGDGGPAFCSPGGAGGKGGEGYTQTDVFE